MDEQERRRREDRSAYLNELLKRTDEDWNEDMMHVLLDQRVSANINEDKDEKKTFGQKAADAVARFAGSWAFIFSLYYRVVVIGAPL